MERNKLITIGIITISLLTLILGSTLLSLSGTIISNGIDQSSKLIKGSEDYKNWVQSPDPIYKKIYFWNTTWDEAKNKFKVKEIGPFIYRVHAKKENITASSGRISYEEVRWYTFENNSVHDESFVIASLNFPLLNVLDKLKYSNTTANITSDLYNAPLIIHKTVKELLWGYEDAVISEYNNDHTIFGIFVENSWNSSTDGRYEIYDGIEDIDTLGEIYEWNNSRELKYWNTKSGNAINGTDGTIFSPHLNDTLYYFSTSLCRSIQLNYVRDSSIKGITSRFYQQSIDTYANVKDFCTPDCGYTYGVMNVSTCKDAPMMLSNPHFYQATHYKERGMKGNSSHLSSFHIAKETGTLLQMNKGMQINFYYNSSPLNKHLENATFQVIAVLWLNEVTQISDEHIAEMDVKEYRTQRILTTVASFLIIVSVLVIVAMMSLYAYKRYQMYKENQVGRDGACKKLTSSYVIFIVVITMLITHIYIRVKQDMNSLIPSDTI